MLLTESEKKDEEEEMVVVIDEVKAVDADDNAAADDLPQTASTFQPGLQSEKVSIVDSGNYVRSTLEILGLS